MPKPKRSKKQLKRRARTHQTTVKGRRRVKMRSRAVTAVSRSRRKARRAAKPRARRGRNG
jgi:hypothetical protein